MKTYQHVLSEGLAYKPVQVALLFSGGHDSLVSTHVCATYLNQCNIPFVVYHGDTTIGIPETQEYVKSVCQQFGWKLVIRRPPNKRDWYEQIVKKWGFPGPTRQSHQICYSRLKERALNHFVTHECKHSPHTREVVLLCTGLRKLESKIRMGYLHEVQKQQSKIWCNPIFWWSEQMCERYMAEHNLPRNPVKDKICISGECLCGAFAGKEEFIEICHAFPHVGAELKRLYEVAKDHGHPWPWSSGPTEWYRNNPKGQLSMFMCVGCENKKVFHDAQ